MKILQCKRNQIKYAYDQIWWHLLFREFKNLPYKERGMDLPKELFKSCGFTSFKYERTLRLPDIFSLFTYVPYLSLFPAPLLALFNFSPCSTHMKNCSLMICPLFYTHIDRKNHGMRRDGSQREWCKHTHTRIVHWDSVLLFTYLSTSLFQ